MPQIILSSTITEGDVIQISGLSSVTNVLKTTALQESGIIFFLLNSSGWVDLDAKITVAVAGLPVLFSIFELKLQKGSQGITGSLKAILAENPDITIDVSVSVGSISILGIHPVIPVAADWVFSGKIESIAGTNE
jgi:hypothetical protein